MSEGPQLFKVDPESRESERIEEVDFRQLGFQERRDIQEWVVATPSILGEDLLIIGKELSGFDRTDERLDLLAVDSDGKLVVIELKRDDTGADAHWQAIKYASYFRRATAEKIRDMLAEHEGFSQEEATNRLLQHLGADDLNTLNNDQRIILASHRFAPEVTSAALWLNSKLPGEDLLTCVTLTPYQDSDTGSLYMQATTIIPMPGEEGYVISIDDSLREGPTRGSSFGDKLSKTFQQNKNDEVTRFLKKVSELTLQGLEDEIRPNRTSRWAGQTWMGGKIWRYYHFWYQRNPWGNWGVDYRVNLWQEAEENAWSGNVEFRHNLKGLQDKLTSVTLDPSQHFEPNDIGLTVEVGSGTLNDDFANRIAQITRSFIEQITPIVDALEYENNEEKV